MSKTTGNTAESTESTAWTREETDLPALTSLGRVVCHYAVADAAAQTATETVPARPWKIRLTRNMVKLPIVPGSVSFTWAGNRYVDRLGSIFRNPDPKTGLGVLCGSIDYLSGEVTLDVYDGGDNSITVHSAAGRLGSQYVTEINFRTPGNPLRPGSFTIAGVTMHGERIAATAAFDGRIDARRMEGELDHETGVVSISFGDWIDDSPAYADEDWYDPDRVQNGKCWKPVSVYADSLTYACVVYSYIPLSASLLGLNAVRLPTDGRVPIVKSGDVVVIHNTANAPLGDGAPAAGQTFTLPRPADSVEIYDSADPPLRVPTTMYKHEQGSDQITIDTANNDFSGFTPPLVAMHRIEDMVLVSKTQINGHVILTRGVLNDYPREGTFVSSALLFGDMQARSYGMFDQKTWKNSFSDDIDGDQASATYNEIDYPIQVLNSGAVTERWALVFDSTEHFRIHAEKRGIVGEGYITNDVQPVNTATNKPYFFIDHRGFGTGWAAGNVIRFNTEGAARDFWAVRTTLQGPESEPYDFFTIQPRGDAR